MNYIPVTSGRAVELLGTTRPTANKAIRALLEAGIVQETTGKRRGRVFGKRRTTRLYLDSVSALQKLNTIHWHHSENCRYYRRRARSFLHARL